MDLIRKGFDEGEQRRRSTRRNRLTVFLFQKSYQARGNHLADARYHSGTPNKNRKLGFAFSNLFFDRSPPDPRDPLPQLVGFRPSFFQPLNLRELTLFLKRCSFLRPFLTNLILSLFNQEDSFLNPLPLHKRTVTPDESILKRGSFLRPFLTN